MRVVLFTGKGGVGKTTTSAATALRLADGGQRVLLISTDSAHSLADALDVPLGDGPVPVTAHLDAVQVDAQARFETAWADVQGYLTGLLSHGGVDPVTAEELTVVPGVEEVLALLAVREYAASGRWDVLVVDCAPTAETLRLLALPDALSWYLERVFPVQRRIARTVRPLVSLLGRGDALPPEELFEALVRLADELSALRVLLGDSAVTTVRLVLTPEAMVTAEARRTFTALALYGYEVDLVVANRVFPAAQDPWLRGWVAAQHRQLQTVRESFVDVPVRELAYRPAEPVGLEPLRSVAHELYGDGPLLELTPRRGPMLLVEPDPAGGPGGRLLRMRIPLAGRGQVHAARVGDELVVTVQAHRRVVALPAGLRTMLLAGGSYRDGELRVRFRPEAGARPRPRPTPRGAATPAGTARTEDGA